MSSAHHGPDEETEQQPGLAGVPRVAAFWDGGASIVALPARGSLTLGRAVECDVAIDHKSVSRRHAVLHVGPELVLEDLGSSNGTRVRGRALAAGEKVPIGPGDVIELGATMVSVLRATETRAVTTSERARSSGSASERGPGTAPMVVLAPSMVRIHRLAGLVAATDVSVLVCGETGAGKDVIASAIHRLSPRAPHPFVCLNCAALPEALLESELFGHERGAFTGADKPKPGLFEAASGGTVFLDEVGEMAPAIQAKLLRAVESRQVTRVGSLRPIAIDVRIVAATNRDLEALVRQGGFRQDLYFRLNGVTLPIPPLRERVDEIVPLAELFVAQAAAATGEAAPSLASATCDILRRHSWPGNVRELKNVVSQAMIFREGARTVEPSHLPPALATARPSPATAARPATPAEPGLRRDLDAFEKERIVAALEQCSGNQTRAAALLGISRRTLLSRLDAYGLPRPRK